MRKLVLIGAAAALLAGGGCRKRNDEGATRTSDPQQVGQASGGNDYYVTPGSGTVGEGTSATERVAGVAPATDPGRAPAAPDSRMAGNDRGRGTTGTTAMTADQTGVPGTTGTAASPGQPSADNPAETPSSPGDAPADLQLAGRIQQVVMESSLQDYAPVVTVVTNNGIVTLRGTVKTEADKLAFTSIVNAVDGVRAVSNQLQVAPVESNSGHHSGDDK